MSNWVCKRCETVNSDGVQACEVCDSPLLYTHEEVQQLITKRVKEVKAKAAKAAKAVEPAPVKVTPCNCDGVWAVAFVLGLLLLMVFLGQ